MHVGFLIGSYHGNTSKGLHTTSHFLSQLTHLIGRSVGEVEAFKRQDNSLSQNGYGNPRYSFLLLKSLMLHSVLHYALSEIRNFTAGFCVRRLLRSFTTASG